jgi:acetylglutamate kinase
LSTVRQAVLSSLSAIGATQEAQFYADLFSKDDPERFALILIDPRVLNNPLFEALTSNMQILSNLGLAPILLIGASEDNRTSIKFQAQRIARELDGSGVKSTRLNTQTYGLIGEIQRRTKAGIIPILEMTERRGPGGIVKLINDLRPNKIVSLQPSGGLSINGVRRRNLRLAEIEPFIEQHSLTPGQQSFLRMIQRVEQEANEGRRSYVLASPLNLLPELFTTRGSGTLIRRGAAIIRHDSFKDVDQDAMRQAVERAFDKPLKSVLTDENVEMAYLEPDYRAGAIFTRLADHLYLSKFWVVPESQGEGLARDVWDRITEENPEFFWRSRSKNPFNDWYVSQCDGLQKRGEWRVFWKGLNPTVLSTIIDAASNASDDFKMDYS